MVLIQCSIALEKNLLNKLYLFKLGAISTLIHIAITYCFLVYLLKFVQTLENYRNLLAFIRCFTEPFFKGIEWKI